MFSGIIEAMGNIVDLKTAGTNRTFFLTTPFLSEVHTDQSISHNGVCLTVEKVHSDHYQVTAIQETLTKTMLGDLKTGDRVNLERSVTGSMRMDGHFVQGHVDACGVITEIKEFEGSREYLIQYSEQWEELVVGRGSIAVNGISLTVANSFPEKNMLSVAIIPFTYEHTDVQFWKVGGRVNLEFDILGKYVSKILSLRLNKERNT